MKRNALWKELDIYFSTLQHSRLSEASRVDYYYFAECFVRWLSGEFAPGDNVRTPED